MTDDPDVHDLAPEMGTTRNYLEKFAILVTWILCGIILAIFYGVTGLFQNRPLSMWSSWELAFSLGLHIGLTIFVWRLLRRYRFLRFKHKRGDYESAILAKKEAESQARKARSEAGKKAAEKTKKLASGAIGLIQDAVETVSEKLEERATQVKDSSPVAKGSEQSDIAGRLEKLSNLHEQGHISDEEFTQQRSRILDEV